MKKEFDRSVCFMFFESYLEQGKLVKQLYNSEVAYKYLEGIIEYGLYQKESEDPLIKMLVAGLKNTIDAGQEKRKKGFPSKENKETEEAILKCKAENPKATQREIANIVGCSLGKVNKVLNANLTTNNNVNDNSNTTSNSMNMNVNKVHDSSSEIVITGDESRGKKRILTDLEDEELESLVRDLKAGVKAGKTYPVLYKEYNLENAVLSKNTINEIQDILKTREEQVLLLKREQLKKQIEREFSKYPEKKEKLIKYTELEGEEQTDFFQNIEKLDRSIDTIIKFYEETLTDEGENLFGKYYYITEYSEYSVCKDNYFGFIKDMLDSNDYPKF